MTAKRLKRNNIKQTRSSKYVQNKAWKFTSTHTGTRINQVFIIDGISLGSVPNVHREVLKFIALFERQ